MASMGKGAKMNRAVVITSTTLAACGVFATVGPLVTNATSAVNATVNARPACGNVPCPLTTTRVPVAVKLGRLKSSTVATAKGTVNCYHIQGWESWNTRLGKLTFFDQIYWCGTPYVKAYASRTQCNPFHRLVSFWNSDTGNCTFGYGKNVRVIHTEATQDWKLTSPTSPLVLQEIEPKLCVDVYANGFAKITCHD